jgi:NADH dehydrogenase (ubiquinone) Fe-S protein 4
MVMRSGDAVQAMRLRFHHREEAIQFAEKQGNFSLYICSRLIAEYVGWDYIVQEDQQPVFKGKSYSDNYKYVPGKLRIAKTK